MARQLVVDGLRFGLNDRHILGPITLEVHQGEKLAIAGPTGAGKSSLLKLIGGLLQPVGGTILFEGKKVIGPLDQLIPGHPHIAYHSQHFELHNNYLVYDFLEYRSEMEEPELRTLFELCRIDHLLGRKTNSGLSGGEKQRIVLAKTLAKKPRMLLLDEPFSNLDSQHGQLMQQVIHDICAHYGITAIMVSHDVPQMLAWADRVGTMHHGLITQLDTPERIYQQPATPMVAAALGIHHWLDANLAPKIGLSHCQRKLPAGASPPLAMAKLWHTQ